MNKVTELHRTTIQPAEMLSVGVECVTYAEAVANHYEVYFMFETCLDLDIPPAIRTTGGKTYLQVNIEGLENAIRAELPSLDAARDVGKSFHEIGCLYAESMIPMLQALTLAAIAEQM